MVGESAPMSDTLVTKDQFRRALRLWPSGVSVVSSRRGDVLHGMTVSSLTSVSLDPPLVSVCCDLATRTLELIDEVGLFAVTILSADQSDLSNRFASKELEDVRFDGPLFHSGENGCPLLDGATAELECSVFAKHRAGDHDIVIGAVTCVRVFDRSALMYYDGAYRTLS